MTTDVTSAHTFRANLIPSQIVVLRTATGTQAIEAERIRCFISDGKNSLLHFGDEAKTLTVFHSLKELEQEHSAASTLVRCNQSLIVNLAYCPCWKSIGKEAIVRVMEYGVPKSYPVSRTYKAEFIRRWREYYEKQ